VPPAGSSSAADRTDLGCDFTRGPLWDPDDHVVEYFQQAAALDFGELAGPRRVVGDRFAHDETLRLAQALGRLAEAPNSFVVKRKRHFYHTITILYHIKAIGELARLTHAWERGLGD
jgi:hypothetical protein